MKKLLILFFLVQSIFCQEEKFFWDGKNWNALNNNKLSTENLFLLKKTYINGLQDGRLYDYFKLWSVDSLFVNKNLKPELDDYLSSSELVRLIDDFYLDPTNTYIPIISTILILNMRARGFSKFEIDKYINESKNWINSLTLEMKNKNYFDVMSKKKNKN
ncbi:MAG: hypothetical protein CMG48_02570 [Candidatus Marinimicrobia bacterium]|nr:hypothetical protein [Candidatus Neomarinimicrobiota bacterium]